MKSVDIIIFTFSVFCGGGQTNNDRFKIIDFNVAGKSRCTTGIGHIACII